MTSELENIRSFLTGQALTAVLAVVFELAFVAVMHVYSPILRLNVALIIPLYILILVRVTPVLRRRLNEKFDREAEDQDFLVESIGAAGTLKALAVEPQMQSRWEQQLAAYVDASFRAQNLSNLAGKAIQLVSKRTADAVLWFGARLVTEGQLSVANRDYFKRLFPPASTVFTVHRAVSHAPPGAQSPRSSHSIAASARISLHP